MMSEPMPPYIPPKPPAPASYPAGSRELIFGGMLLLCTMTVCNFTAFGGFNLGFAIGLWLCVGCSAVYLWKPGKGKAYPLTLLGLCLVMAAGFARSDDGFVKLVLMCFLFVGINLGLTLLAGKNRWDPGSIYCLEDVAHSVFILGLARLEYTFRGVKEAVQNGGKMSKNVSSVLLGLLIALPLLLIVVPLLIRADAAFDGLMRLLPDFRLEEVVLTLWFSLMLFPVLFSRGLGLGLGEVKKPLPGWHKGLAELTLNTVLIAVCAVYAVYLLSQLAYFVGGFAGILPEEFTLAQYARRGFFEMSWLSAINLVVIVGSAALSKNRTLLTRLLCLFIGAVTVFFVATAGAKMALYIDSFGLTRLRVLTLIIMLFLGLTTVIVCVWLFVPKLRYMQAVLLLAMLIGTGVIWADVDTQVARYNVTAYLRGSLDTVDVGYLGSLGDGTVPWLARLAGEAPDETVATLAETFLQDRRQEKITDFREWNYVNYKAGK